MNTLAKTLAGVFVVARGVAVAVPSAFSMNFRPTCKQTAGFHAAGTFVRCVPPPVHCTQMAQV